MSDKFEKIELLHLVADKEDRSILFNNTKSKTLILIVILYTKDNLENERISKYLYPGQALLVFSSEDIRDIQIMIYKKECESKTIIFKEYLCTMVNRNYDIDEENYKPFITAYSPVCQVREDDCDKCTGIIGREGEKNFFAFKNNTTMEIFYVDASYMLNSQKISKISDNIYSTHVWGFNLPEGATDINIVIKQAIFIKIWRTVATYYYSMPGIYCFETISTGLFTFVIKERQCKG